MKCTNEIITARRNPTVMWAASLGEKKGRDTEQSFLAEGVKLFVEAVKAKLDIPCVFLSESKKDFLMPLLEMHLQGKNYENTRVILLSDSCFEKISTEKSPQGIIVAIKYLDFFKSCTKIIEEEYYVTHPCALVLDAIRDPGNLGAVIRSAAAFGATRLILSSDCADVYHPRTVRAAMGTLFRTEILFSSDLVQTVLALRKAGHHVYAGELRENARPLAELVFDAGDAVIIGNEGHGIAPEVSAVCDGSVYIPIAEHVESLNAGVAAAIFLYHQNRV